jgi:hypothetical protein
MVKVRVIKEFNLSKFNELKNIIRISNQNEEGSLFVGDIFECTEDMANYLTKTKSHDYSWLFHDF